MEIEESIVAKESTFSFTLVETNKLENPLERDFSSFKKLLRITCIVFRFIKKMRNKNIKEK